MWKCALLALGLVGTLHAQREERTRRPEDRYPSYDRNYNPNGRNYNPDDRNYNDRNSDPSDRRHYQDNRNYNPQTGGSAQDRNYNPQDRAYNDRYNINDRPYNYGQNDRQFSPRSSHDVGDTRCPNAKWPEMEMTVSVNLDGGRVVQGRYVYLCDGPEVAEYNRPGRQGRPITSFYKNISVFLGIPYAEPPTKERNLRFMPPRVPEAWRVIRAEEYKPACPQHYKYYGEPSGVDRVDEDCLYLNVFTPNVKQDMLTKYATMVYIHGGNWDHGHANSYPPHMLCASQEVVVVTFNYRLGALGFLATGDSVSPGNYGILDQSMAIQWVYENIRHFNGDPNNIVLFGPDAGAASAGLHAFSPRTNDVVHRVIGQSGSALAEWAAILDPTFMYNASRLFGEAVGCTQTSSYDLVECLRQRSIADLTNIQKKPQVGWLLWGPVLDNVTASEKLRFLPRSPLELMETEAVPDGFAYLAGVTRDEGATMLMEDEEIKKNRYRVTKDIFQRKVRQYMNMYNYTLNAEAINSAISFMYTDWAGPDNETLLRQGYIDMLSDSFYVAPNDKIIKKLLGRGIKTYMYVLNYTIEGRPRDMLWNDWITHNTEYYLATGGPFMPPSLYPSNSKIDKFQWTDGDRNMSILIMKTWANFAKYGNTTPESLFNTILWQPMRQDLLQYMSINTTNLTSTMLRDYRQKQCQFWNHYLPSLIGKEPVTWPPEYEPWELREKRVYSAALYSMVGSAALFFILMLIFCCLYCSAKSTHLVEDEGIPETNANHEFLLQGPREFGRKHDPEMVIMHSKTEKNTRV